MIRWLIQSDLNQVMEIENSFDLFTTKEEIISSLQQKSRIGLVYEIDEEICGFMIYSCEEAYYFIHKLVIDEDHRGRGIATELIDKLANKLGDKRDSIILQIRETNQNALLFLKSLGFKGFLVPGEKWNMIEMEYSVSRIYDR